MQPFQIAILVGSLRHDSFNRKLATAVAKLGPANFGFTPLRIDASDVAKVVDILADIMQNALWDRPEYKTRAKVT